MPLNYKNKNVKFEETLSDTVKNNNSLKRNYLHFGNVSSKIFIDRYINILSKEKFILFFKAINSFCSIFI